VRYEERVHELLAQLARDATPARRRLAQRIADVPRTIRGFGHVKQANLALAQAREAELLHQLDPGRYPAPPRAATAGQFKGIPITTSQAK
jgi:indolepyruvate ferredoxin oxidoreductase